MQNTKIPRTLHATDAWLFDHAQALIAYAHTDREFAHALVHQLYVRHWRPSDSLTTDDTNPYLIPIDRDNATRTTHWLLSTLDERPEAIRTRGLLATYAYEYEVPKDVIFGIVGLAIIGPTLGLIQQKKKKRSHLQVIIRDTWYESHTPKQFTALVQTISMQVIARELRYAGGNAFRLHPDTAAWCLEEPLTKIHIADKVELAQLRKVAQAERLSHQTKAGVAIAISPTVNEAFVHSFAVREIP